jgi:phosphatidylserine/phosphatidylglycerophosphate/cardiolipin synthase-like enzyme
MPDNLVAFAWRFLSARAATRTLDLQYYRWAEDVTGRLLANIIADPPGKRLGRRRPPGVLGAIRNTLGGAQKRVILVSPYFVPGRRGSRLLINLLRRGVAVSILTNSLAATDVLDSGPRNPDFRRVPGPAQLTRRPLRDSGGLAVAHTVLVAIMR